MLSRRVQRGDAAVGVIAEVGFLNGIAGMARLRYMMALVDILENTTICPANV
jgi:hypothetical protein